MPYANIKIAAINDRMDHKETCELFKKIFTEGEIKVSTIPGINDVEPTIEDTERMLKELEEGEIKAPIINDNPTKEELDALFASLELGEAPLLCETD